MLMFALTINGQLMCCLAWSCIMDSLNNTTSFPGLDM